MRYFYYLATKRWFQVLAILIGLLFTFGGAYLFKTSTSIIPILIGAVILVDGMATTMLAIDIMLSNFKGYDYDDDDDYDDTYELDNDEDD